MGRHCLNKESTKPAKRGLVIDLKGKRNVATPVPDVKSIGRIRFGTGHGEGYSVATIFSLPNGDLIHMPVNDACNDYTDLNEYYIVDDATYLPNDNIFYKKLRHSNGKSITIYLGEEGNDLGKKISESDAKWFKRLFEEDTKSLRQELKAEGLTL